MLVIGAAFFCSCHRDLSSEQQAQTGGHSMTSTLNLREGQWQPAWYWVSARTDNVKHWQLDERRSQFIPVTELLYNRLLESARPLGAMALFDVWQDADGSWWGLEGLSPLTLVELAMQPIPVGSSPPEAPKFSAQLMPAQLRSCPHYGIDSYGRLSITGATRARASDSMLSMSVSDAYSLIADEAGWSIVSKACVRVPGTMRDVVTIVFDLDETVAYDVHGSYDGPGLIEFIDPEFHSRVRTRILPGFEELIAWLDAMPDTAIGFLSHAHPTRLIPLLQAIRLADGRSLYDVCNIVFSMRGTKDVRVLRGANHRRVILIDNDTHMTNQQYRNMLHLPQAWQIWKVGYAEYLAEAHFDEILFSEAVYYYHHYNPDQMTANPLTRDASFRMKAAEPAKAFLIAGVLDTVLKAERETPGTLLDTLAAFRPANQDVDGTGADYPDLMANDTLQQQGLSILRAFNSSLTLPDRTWLMTEVPKATWSSEANTVQYTYDSGDESKTFIWHRLGKGDWYDE